MRKARRICCAVLLAFLPCTVASAQLGQLWNQATPHAAWSPRYGHSSVVFGEKLWAIGGRDLKGACLNDVWCSSDGAAWARVAPFGPWVPRFGHTSVVHNGKIWIIGGHSDGPPSERNDVWYSPDGISWSAATRSAPWSPRGGHTSVVFDGKIWVIGAPAPLSFRPGGNDVWYSADGVKWTSATLAAPWPGRSGHTSVVFDGKMWVIGGYPKYSDVWYSADGIKWTSATLSAPWSPRWGHTSVVWRGKIWVIGFGDVWYSSDGADWRLATVTPGWLSRVYQTSVVHNGAIWILGGYNGVIDMNDVWYSPAPTAVHPWRLYP